MKVGFGIISCQHHPDDARTDVDLYRDALELAAEADRLGFDSVWVSEHHFFDDGYLPSLLPMCAAIAARTTRAEIGTGVVLAPLIHPLRLAEDAAVVDLISAGRLILGLGLGWLEEEFAAFGVPVRERVQRLTRAIEVLRAAWGDGAGDGVAVTPKPARPGGPPIWIGAMAEPAIRRAGRLADGFMGTEVTPAAFAEQVAWVREAAEKQGRDPDAVAISVHLPTFAWPGDDAWARVRDSYWYVTWKYEAVESSGSPSRVPPLPADREAALRADVLLGSPEAVAERILEFDEAAGGGLHYVARLYWPGMDPGVQREAVAVFGEQVLPLLRRG